MIFNRLEPPSAQANLTPVETGNEYLPHPALYGWADVLIEEATVFPNARYVR